MNYDDLVNILLSDKPSVLIKKNEEDIFNLVPELKLSKGFNQNTIWHIYDVYNHTLSVIDNVENNKLLRITALFHDIGKPLTYTEDSEGIGHFYNHWNKSIEIFNSYKEKFELSESEFNLISNLIFYHDLNVSKLNVYELKEFIDSIGKDNINLLFSLKRADLLAQSSQYHYLMNNVNIQEQKIIKSLKK